MPVHATKRAYVTTPMIKGGYRIRDLGEMAYHSRPPGLDSLLVAVKRPIRKEVVAPLLDS